MTKNDCEFEVAKERVLLLNIMCLALPLCAATFWAQRPSEVAACVALAMLPYAAFVAHGKTLGPQVSLGIVAALGVLLLPSDPKLSDDLYRYLWDGRVLLSGTNPYAHAPSSPALAFLRDSLYPQINHAHIPTIYPPLAQIYFASVELFFHHPIAMKIAALAGHMLVVHKLHTQNAHAALVYGLNPLALCETAMNGHIDVWCGLFFLHLALAESLRTRATFAVLAGLSKLVGFLLLPLVFLRARWSARHIIFAIASSSIFALTILVIAEAGARDNVYRSEAPAISHYGQRWQGDSPVYPLVESLTLSITQRTLEISETDYLRFPIPGLVRSLEGTPADPWRPYERDKKPITHREFLPLSLFVSWVSRWLIFGVLMVATLALWRKTFALAVRHLLLLLLLVIPQLNPWYLLWLLPVEALLKRWVVIIWSAAVLVAYVPLDLWTRLRIWNPWDLASMFQLVFIALAILAEWHAIHKRRSNDAVV